jgi:hypothetical protein
MDYIYYATCNYDAIQSSTECACVYCLEKYAPALINDWCNDYDKTSDKYLQTAICPKCGIDSVIPNSLIKYTDTDLKNWHIAGFEVTLSNGTIYDSSHVNYN